MIQYVSIDDIKNCGWMFGVAGRSLSKTPVGGARPFSGAWLTLGKHAEKATRCASSSSCRTDFGTKMHLYRPSLQLQFSSPRWAGQVALGYFPAQRSSITLPLAQASLCNFHLQYHQLLTWWYRKSSAEAFCLLFANNNIISCGPAESHIPHQNVVSNQPPTWLAFTSSVPCPAAGHSNLCVSI
jgi:hypothetical protein